MKKRAQILANALIIAIGVLMIFAALRPQPAKASCFSFNTCSAFVIQNQYCRYGIECCGVFPPRNGCDHEDGPCLSPPPSQGEYEACLANNCSCSAP